MAQNYQGLIVWQKAMALVKLVYQASRHWPADEKFGLVSQIRRAAVSIPSDIAEGDGRGSDADLIRFLFIAHGSLREVETQLLIAVDLEFSAPEETKALLEHCAEVGKLLNGLIRKLRGQ